jgi:hypothetical protein
MKVEKRVNDLGESWHPNISLVQDSGRLRVPTSLLQASQVDWQKWAKVFWAL